MHYRLFDSLADLKRRIRGPGEFGMHRESGR